MPERANQTARRSTEPVDHGGWPRWKVWVVGLFASAIVIIAMFWITWAVVGGSDAEPTIEVSNNSADALYIHVADGPLVSDDGVFVAAATSATVACPSGVGFVVTDAALRSVDTGVCPDRDLLVVVVTAEMVNN